MKKLTLLLATVLCTAAFAQGPAGHHHAPPVPAAADAASHSETGAVEHGPGSAKVAETGATEAGTVGHAESAPTGHDPTAHEPDEADEIAAPEEPAPPEPEPEPATLTPPRIAVYVTGNVKEDEKIALSTRILAALVNSGRYTGIERSESFLAKIDEEHVKQRSGAIDDGQISELGKQFGVKFVCIAAITPAFGAFQVSARVIDVETAQVIHIGESNSPLDNMDDFTWVSDEVVHVMFGGEPRPRPVRKRSGMSIGAGGVFTSGFGGGVTWGDGSAVAMPYTGGGAYLFFDAFYGKAVLGWSTGGGRWKSAAASSSEPPDMERTFVSIGAYAKYPHLYIGPVQAFPLVGFEYEISVSGKIISEDGYEEIFDGRDGRTESSGLSALWIRFGVGSDADISERLFLRGELLYGVRTANEHEKALKEQFRGDNTQLGHGLMVRVAAGFRL